MLNSTATPGSLDPSWHGSIIILTLAALSRFHDLNIYQMNGGDGGEVEENRGEPKVPTPRWQDMTLSFDSIEKRNFGGRKQFLSRLSYIIMRSGKVPLVFSLADLHLNLFIYLFSLDQVLYPFLLARTNKRSGIKKKIQNKTNPVLYAFLRLRFFLRYRVYIYIHDSL